MEVIVKLEKSTFVNEHGEPIEYYNFVYDCIDGDTVKVKVKADKAKLVKQDVILRKGAK